MKQGIFKIGIVLVISGFSLVLRGQQAGSSTYEFLTMTSSARQGALGGNQVGLDVNDVSFLFSNPAYISDSMHTQLSFSFMPYVSDVKVLQSAYVHHDDRLGTFGLGVHAISYGEFIRADEDGVKQGTFSAAEYAIHLTYAKALSPYWQAAISIKPVISNFEQYNSFGLAADIGATYKSPDGLFSFGAVLKNVGSQITSYNNTIEPIPTDLQIGFAKKLAHAPFRIAVTAQDLLDWDMKYTVKNGSGDEIEGSGNQGSGIDQLARHFVLGAEFVPSSNFYIGFGYNHRRRKEMAITEKMGTAGFSWGFGFKVYKFKFGYGSARYHLGGSSNHFTLSSNLSDFYK